MHFHDDDIWLQLPEFISLFCFLIEICQHSWGFNNDSTNFHKKTMKQRILIRWNISSIQGTPPFRGYKIWPGKKYSHHLCIRYLYWRDTSISGGRETFSGSRNLVKSTSIERTSYTFVIKKWRTKEFVDTLKRSLVTMATAFKTWINWLKRSFDTSHDSLKRSLYFCYITVEENEVSLCGKNSNQFQSPLSKF